LKKEIPHTAKKDVAVTKFALKQHVYVYCTTRPTDANTSKRHNKQQTQTGSTTKSKRSA
jgi:hypothetical protein